LREKFENLFIYSREEPRNKTVYIEEMGGNAGSMGQSVKTVIGSIGLPEFIELLG